MPEQNSNSNRSAETRNAVESNVDAVACELGDYCVGDRQPLLVIAGPCVLESEELTLQIAEHLAGLPSRLPIQLVFKASFDKANRSRASAYRGPGLDEGLRMLDAVRQKTGLPVTTDIHEPSQAAAVAEVCQLIQIPAFLARQTDLLDAAAKTGRTVNVKKGQFMAPRDMAHVVGKLRDAGCDNLMLCERGTFFGYGQLVNDMRGLVEMRQLGVPVVFDATHSVQNPGGTDGTTTGNRAMVWPLSRAAAAVGIDGVFLETHPHPDSSPSDAANMVPLDQSERLIRQIVDIRQAVAQFTD